MNKSDLCYMDFGTVPINEANELNIPINCRLQEPDENDRYWHWYAENLTDELGVSVVEYQAFHIASLEEKDILSAVRAYVVPLYSNAMKSLAKTGQLSWKEKRNERNRDTAEGDSDS